MILQDISSSGDQEGDIRLSENQGEGYQTIRGSRRYHRLISYYPDIHYRILWFPDRRHDDDTGRYAV